MKRGDSRRILAYVESFLQLVQDCLHSMRRHADVAAWSLCDSEKGKFYGFSENAQKPSGAAGRSDRENT